MRKLGIPIYRMDRCYFVSINFPSKLLDIINGELQGVISKRKLTEEEQRTVKEAKEKMDKEMADTVIEQQKLKQQIQQQISDDVQKTLSFWQNINWPLGWLRPAWF